MHYIALAMSTTSLPIFVVEDDQFYGELLVYHLSMNPENQVERFTTAKDLMKNLHRNPGIITLDYSLPDMKGDELLRKIKEYDPNIAVIIVSGQEDISTAIEMLRQGAYDYIVKNEDTKNRLWKVINNVRQNIEMRGEIAELTKEVKTKYDFSNSIIGNSPAIKNIFHLVEKACNSSINVSITGETGTGKEVVARTIHFNSPRARKKFVAVNVTAIPRELIESELFGHEKGAFTGATERRIGKFEEAHGGTLFLDEIGEMDASMQAKLLRVLQEREITRVGGNQVVKVDVRIIVATHRNLQEEVKKGNFREDLFYRVIGLPVELPPLRERGSDILLIAKNHIETYCKDNKLKKINISDKAQEKLMQYPYPGNVRELKSIMDLACVMCDGNTIEDEHIRFRTLTSDSDIFLKEMTLEQYSVTIIKRYLEKYENNVLKVAEKLDVGKSTIYRMMKEGKL
jgi:DNA-binding NtrC family response regulator